MTTPTRHGTVRRAEPSEPTRSRSLGPSGPGDRFGQPLGRRLEPLAAGAARRFRGGWRAPLAVVAASFVGAVLALTLLGWLLVHTPLGSPVRHWDQSVSLDLSTGRTSGWNGYSRLATSGADTFPVIGVMVLISVVLAVFRRWRDLLFVPLALGLELSTFLTVNYLVARPRPDVAQLGGEPGTHSFPSGHVAATFVLYGGIAVLLGIGRWRTPYKVLGWIVVAIPVVSVAFSRTYRGMHYPTDVLVGLILGMTAIGVSAVATRSSWLGSRGPEEAAP